MSDGVTPKDVLTVYDAGYVQHYGVRAPIVGAKDAKLAKGLLERGYTLAQLEDWLGVFFRHPDPFIAQSGHTFGVFVACIGKCITSRPPPAPPPPLPLVELAKSIARTRAEDAERGQQQLRAREQELMALGLSEPLAVMQAGREWLKRQ